MALVDHDKFPYICSCNEASVRSKLRGIIPKGIKIWRHVKNKKSKALRFF